MNGGAATLRSYGVDPGALHRIGRAAGRLRTELDRGFAMPRMRQARFQH